MDKICKKCNKKLPMSQFAKCRWNNKRSICINCNYSHVIFWKRATYVEKLNRVSKRFNEKVIKKEDCWFFSIV